MGTLSGFYPQKGLTFINHNTGVIPMRQLKWFALIILCSLGFSIFIMSAIEEYNKRACVNAFATSNHTVEDIDKICK